MRYLLTLLFFNSIFAFTQVKSDALLWTGLGIDIKPIKKLRLKYESQLRFDKNCSSFYTYYNELAIDYELFKKFELGGNYRYSRQKAAFFKNDNRFCLNAKYTVKLKKLGLRIKTRARYQFSFDRISQINNIIYPEYENTFRLKFDLKYKNDALKRIQPRLFYELFKSLEPYNTKKGQLNAYRIGVGIDLDLPKRQELSFKYMYDHNQHLAHSIAHIYMIQYNYSLKLKSKKKKTN